MQLHPACHWLHWRLIIHSNRLQHCIVGAAPALCSLPTYTSRPNLSFESHQRPDLSSRNMLSTGCWPCLQMEELTGWYKTHCKAELVLPGSALNSSSVEEIKAWAASKLPDGPTLYPKSQVGRCVAGTAGRDTGGGCYLESACHCCGPCWDPKHLRQLIMWLRPGRQEGRVGCHTPHAPQLILALLLHACELAAGTLTLLMLLSVQISEQPERFFVSEIIREHIFLQYEQEVPYCTQVGQGTGRCRHGHMQAYTAVMLWPVGVCA